MIPRTIDEHPCWQIVAHLFDVLHDVSPSREVDAEETPSEVGPAIAPHSP